MSALGGGNFGQEVRVASEQGTGGPSQHPGSGDKRSVLLLLAGLVAFAGLVALVAR